MNGSLSVLLATYNGEKYLPELLDSLFSQTLNNFTLYVRDDCSSDNTWEILMEYANRYPTLFAEKAEANSGSAKNNFLEMMLKHKSDYTFLCDQDDVWLPDKIEKTLEVLRQTENKYGKDVPIIAHSDLKVVDNKLNVISMSYRKSASCNYNHTALNNLLTQNIVTGSTACYNRALGELIRRPEFTMMHDMWIAMIAAAFGKIVHSDETLLLYRQHGGNELGAKSIMSFSNVFQRLLQAKKTKARLDETYTQAKAFSSAYSDKLSDEQKTLISEYCRIPQMNKLGRVSALIRLKALRSPKLGHLLFV